MEERYFAASNSEGGFVNYFPQCFGDVDKLYVIKGGSGTGKSYFMRKCGRAAENVGAGVVNYYCSSDPRSLDGVKITMPNGRTLAVIDGTPPHAWELKLPGAFDEILNLGDFWEASKLYANRDEIKGLADEKSEAYAAAYKYLAAMGKIYDVEDAFATRKEDTERIRAVARELTAGQVKGGAAAAKIRPALLSSMGSGGRVTFDTFSKKAKKTYTASDIVSNGHALLRFIFDIFSQHGCDMLVSYDPVRPSRIDGIFVESTQHAFVLGEPKFYSDENKKLLFSLENAVTGSMKAASKIHFEIEKIYSSAMDFERKGKFEDEFCSKVFN